MLSEIRIINFRNICEFSLKIPAKMCFVCGRNGAGKTSFLEALYFLAFGRSFRVNNYKKVINFNAKSFIVNTTLSTKISNDLLLGVERFRSGETKFRLNNQNANTFLELSKYLPLQLINTNSHLLLEGEPEIRRKFIDWFLFHVEHDFVGIWRNFLRALKQRNAALKNDPSGVGSITATAQVWDSEFVKAAERLNEKRQRVVPLLQDKLNEILNTFDGGALGSASLEYRSGWGGDLKLKDELVRLIDRDVSARTTTVGPHRADLIIKINNQPARAVLSRGQAKLLVFALSLARAEILREKLDINSIFLIDDLQAELDKHSVAASLEALESFSYQSIITSITEPASWAKALNPGNVFHVEQGCLLEG